nr:hypothetical protein [Bacteroidota bacterium]
MKLSLKQEQVFRYGGKSCFLLCLLPVGFRISLFDSMAFDRDYKSYFPISVTTIKIILKLTLVVNDLKISDRIIRNNEIIPLWMHNTTKRKCKHRLSLCNRRIDTVKS